MKKIISIILFCSILVGCSGKNQEDICQYHLMDKSELGNYLEQEYTRNYLDVVLENTVKVEEQSVMIKNYKIVLEEYFYEKNTASVIYQFTVCNQDGTDLEENQYNQFCETHEEGMIGISNERFNASVIVDKVVKNKKGRTIWIVGMLLSAITNETQRTQIDSTEGMTYLDILYDTESPQRIKVPDYVYSNAGMKMDKEEDKEILSLTVNSLGICIVKDLTSILTEFKMLIENLPKGEDPETYGYDAFDSVIVILKNGNEYVVYGENQTAIMIDNLHISEENKMASYTALWNEMIDVEQIEYIIVDGVIYKVVDDSFCSMI